MNVKTLSLFMVKLVNAKTVLEGVTLGYEEGRLFNFLVTVSDHDSLFASSQPRVVSYDH